MSATRYRRFLKLCEEWPKDESKKGRDLGTFLRQRVASAFREGENTQVGELLSELLHVLPLWQILHVDESDVIFHIMCSGIQAFIRQSCYFAGYVREALTVACT